MLGNQYLPWGILSDISKIEIAYVNFHWGREENKPKQTNTHTHKYKTPTLLWL